MKFATLNLASLNNGTIRLLTTCNRKSWPSLSRVPETNHCSRLPSWRLSPEAASCTWTPRPPSQDIDANHHQQPLDPLASRMYGAANLRLVISLCLYNSGLRTGRSSSGCLLVYQVTTIFLSLILPSFRCFWPLPGACIRLRAAGEQCRPPLRAKRHEESDNLCGI